MTNKTPSLYKVGDWVEYIEKGPWTTTCRGHIDQVNWNEKQKYWTYAFRPFKSSLLIPIQGNDQEKMKNLRKI